MNDKFKLYGTAEVLHLNARKEGPDDDKQLAVDVKLRAVTERQAISFFDDQLADVLFTDIGAVRNQQIGQIPMKNEIEDYRMEVAGSVHYGVRLKKFQLEAMDDNKVAISFIASFKPSGDEVATIAEYLQDEIEVVIEPANEELDFKDAA